MTEAISIGGEKQLFIDDYCLEQLCGTRRQFHQARKHPANPVLSPEEAWEASYIQAYGNVLYDTDQRLFRMWYSARYEPSPGVKFNTVCHAVSTDGINWERSKLDRLEHEGLTLSNAVLKGHCIGPTVLHTPWDPDPARRYRMFVYTGDEVFGDNTVPRFPQAYSAFFSPDGITWTPYENNPVLQGGDISTCCYDPVTKQYIAFPKVHRTDDGCYRRCVGVSASKDFLRWGAPHLILSGDAIDDARVAQRLSRFRDILLYDAPSYYRAEMYGMTGFRYEGLRLGLIWFYDVSARRPAEFRGNDEGIICTQLAYSRHARPYFGWHRAGDRADFIPCGNEEDYDAAMAMASHSVVEVEDELWFYYNGCNRGHGWEPGVPGAPSAMTRVPAGMVTINLATLRRDGFASVSACYPPGRMVTKLLTFTGTQLEVNADAEHGHIIVEILDAEGKPVPGCDRESCVPFQQDAIRGRIRWKGEPNLAALQGKPVRLVFHMQTAKLYAFRFIQ